MKYSGESFDYHSIIPEARQFESLKKTASEVLEMEYVLRSERCIAEIKQPLVDWFKRYLALEEWWDRLYYRMRQWGFDDGVYLMLRFTMVLKEATKQMILQEGG